MKITYVANIRMPTERAHGAQIAKTCEALTHMGAEVALVVPRRHTAITQTPEEYYKLTKTFPIQRVGVIDSVAWGKLGFMLESLSFALSARRYVRGVLYGRDEWVLAILAMTYKGPVVWETHTGAWNWAARYLAKRARFVAISQGLKDYYIEQGVQKEHIVVAHDGVDVSAFTTTHSKIQARTNLELPQGVPVALYVGSLGGWKGTLTLFEAATEIPSDVCVAVIGGTDAEVAVAKRKYPKVHFVGARPYAELANNVVAADVLVLPNTAEDITSARFTSPLKLFAYMAAKVPIVASDVPSIAEVLDTQSAYLVEPDNAKALARGITEALANKEEAQAKALRAYELVLMYDWKVRAGKIMAFIKDSFLIG